MTDQEWAKMCIRGGFRILAAMVGAFAGLALVRWAGWW
jgi:hypothetical protein